MILGSVRLVVDTGMHALGWSREQAIEYSVATEGIHLDEATAEVERYAVWPGQALGYKLGMLKILELRKRAQQQLGDGFDIRTFHDRDGGEDRRLDSRAALAFFPGDWIYTYCSFEKNEYLEAAHAWFER